MTLLFCCLLGRRYLATLAVLNRSASAIQLPPLYLRPLAGVAELVDAPDSKSGSGNRVWVRFPPPAPRMSEGDRGWRIGDSQIRKHRRGTRLYPSSSFFTYPLSPIRYPLSPSLFMKFCSSCGQPVVSRIPTGDHLPRYVCTACGTIHYENPRIIAGCVIETEGKILLCKRAIEPRLGYWTIPAGFMENGESVQAAAAREAVEEALAHVEIASLLAIVNVLHAHQVHIMFRARLTDPRFGIGPESLETALYDENEIPWGDIAFLSVEFALRRYLEDRRAGAERLHFTDIDLR
jgi:ADP-ribose pyrophosphatase YjhB (NUDIX family)